MDKMDINCAICLGDLVIPHITNCGHSFCYKCIYDHLLQSKVALCHKKCPICRSIIRKKKTILHKNIEGLVIRLTEDEEFRERTIYCEEWLTTLQLPKTFQPGDMIDVRDTLFFWCVGTVKQVLSSKEGSGQVLLIHYPGWNSIYNEFIPSDSPRLAPLGTFSSRRDLPQYHDSLFNLPRTIFEGNLGNMQVQFF
jgi:hypothetical protein